MGTQWPYLDAPHPIAFAHRGGAAHAAENSMAAFQRAVDYGFRYIETDVHATADGVLLAFHDTHLHRVTDGVGQIATLPYAQVAPALIDGSEPIPQLADVLGTWPDLRVNIDVKAASAVGPLLDVLRRTNAWDRVCIGAFSDRRVRTIRAAAGPRLATALGPKEVAALRAASMNTRLDWMVPKNVAAAQVPQSSGRITIVDEKFIEAAHRHGIEVHVWTVDEPGQMHQLLDVGVDGIVTDDLEALRQVIDDRVGWTGRLPTAPPAGSAALNGAESAPDSPSEEGANT